MDIKDYIALLGENIHTYFRKFSSSDEASKICDAINSLEDDDWYDALAYVFEETIKPVIDEKKLKKFD